MNEGQTVRKTTDMQTANGQKGRQTKRGRRRKRR